MYAWINVFVDFYQNLTATLRGRQTKSRNFTKILKAQTLKISCRPSNDKIFLLFCTLDFSINDRPIIKKKKRGGGACLPENARKSRKIKSIVLDLSEKIMACTL